MHPPAVLKALRPFTDHVCQACGATCPTLTYCEHRCEPGIQGPNTDAFISTYQHGDGPAPHLHASCSNCRCEWLTACKPASPGGRAEL